MKQFFRLRVLASLLAASLLLAGFGSGLQRGIDSVRRQLGAGKGFRVGRLFERVGAESDPWRQWLLVREILILEPENGWARSQQLKLERHFILQARRERAEDRPGPALQSLVLALRINPQEGYLWIELEKLIRTYPWDKGDAIP